MGTKRIIKKIASVVYVHQPRLTALAENASVNGQRVKIDETLIAAPTTESGSNRLGTVAIKQHTLDAENWGRSQNGAVPEYMSRPKSLDLALEFFNGTPKTCAELAAKAVELGGAPAGVKGSPHNATANHMLARVQQGRAVRVSSGMYAIAPHFRHTPPEKTEEAPKGKRKSKK